MIEDAAGIAPRLASALLLQGGWNASLVAVGAALLGLAAGGAGTFLFLRRRALVSDAASHAALPGVAIAFLVMVALGGDGRFLPGLMLGAAVSAALALGLVTLIARRTRLGEDAAIGAVLSVGFGLGVTLLTVIQVLPAGKAAGLEGFLLGSTAGMLESEAQALAVAGALSALAVFALRRPMTLAAFDPGQAEATGMGGWRIDLAMMGIGLLVTVVGLKVVGLVLVVALLIIPPVAARFWTDRVSTLALLAAAIGGVSGHVGAAISSVAPGLPTGPVIVLVAFAIFVVSFLASPRRGLLAAALRNARLARRLRLRRDLLALERGDLPSAPRALRRRGWIGRDGTPTAAGWAAADAAARDEARWALARRVFPGPDLAGRYDGASAIETALAPDQVAELDRRLALAGAAR